MDAHPLRILLTGATGYVGGCLLPVLLDAGHEVRALARNPANTDLPAQASVVRGDVVSGEGLDTALQGIDVAYYLVHSMGNGNGGDFAETDRRAARNFGTAAKAAGVKRVVYLGGLEPDDSESEHLRSRHEVAEVLREHGPDELVYVRAAMVIGAGSASFQMLEHLVRRLPVMVTPRWIDTRTQPVAIADVARTLSALADHPDPPEEVQLGGAEVLTYREMMDRFAREIGRHPPRILKTPFLSPRLSSYWVALMTPISLGLVQPLVDGMGAEMIVRESPPAGLNDDPRGFEDAIRAALAK